MAFDRHQFRDFVGRSLKRRNLYSPAALNLVLGTAAQESAFGTYLRQKGGGPAIGVFQMEPATFDWLRQKFMPKYNEFVARFSPSAMEGDLDFAAFMCRLRYLAVPESLPDENDLPALALYYKKYYNTIHGKATTEQFIANYKRYVA